MFCEHSVLSSVRVLGRRAVQTRRERASARARRVRPHHHRRRRCGACCAWALATTTDDATTDGAKRTRRPRSPPTLSRALAAHARRAVAMRGNPRVCARMEDGSRPPSPRRRACTPPPTAAARCRAKTRVERRRARPPGGGVTPHDAVRRRGCVARARRRRGCAARDDDADAWRDMTTTRMRGTRLRPNLVREVDAVHGGGAVLLLGRGLHLVHHGALALVGVVPAGRIIIQKIHQSFRRSIVTGRPRPASFNRSGRDSAPRRGGRSVEAERERGTRATRSSCFVERACGDAARAVRGTGVVARALDRHDGQGRGRLSTRHTATAAASRYGKRCAAWFRVRSSGGGTTSERRRGTPSSPR